MTRPLRIEFPGALYHVTSRGDRREAIFIDDADRQSLLAVLEQAMDRFDAVVLAYCLMGNHYHFVMHTRRANLSRLMRHFNGVYTQDFNRRHGKVGHLFQGRFKAVLVDRDAYLLEVCRYVELNPVRAAMAQAPTRGLGRATLRMSVVCHHPHGWIRRPCMATCWAIRHRGPPTAGVRRHAMRRWLPPGATFGSGTVRCGNRFTWVTRPPAR